MALDNTTPRSRRAILAGTIGAAAALAVDAVRRPERVEAGSYVVLGYPNNATSTTEIHNYMADEEGFVGTSTGNAPGVKGVGDAGQGVNGTSSSSVGVYGTTHATNLPAVLGRGYGDSAGLYGISGSETRPATPSMTGVYGYANQSGGAVGVHGQSVLGDGLVGETGASGKSGVFAFNSNAGGWAVNGDNDGALTNGYIGGANGALGQARGGVGSGVVGFAGSGNPPVGPARVGVYGKSDSSDGVVGQSATSGRSGVYGNNASAGGWGLNGSNDGALTNGYIGGFNGALGQARGSTGSGVVGFAGPGSAPDGPSNVGVYGAATSGRGGAFKGNLAQLKLLPSSAASHPSSGQAGDLFVDVSHRLWFCKGSTNWTQLA